MLRGDASQTMITLGLPAEGEPHRVQRHRPLRLLVMPQPGDHASPHLAALQLTGDVQVFRQDYAPGHYLGEWVPNARLASHGYCRCEAEGETLTQLCRNLFLAQTAQARDVVPVSERGVSDDPSSTNG